MPRVSVCAPLSRSTRWLVAGLAVGLVAACTPAAPGGTSGAVAPTQGATAPPASTATAAAPTASPAAPPSTAPSPQTLVPVLGGALPKGWDISTEAGMLSFATASDPPMTIQLLDDQAVMAQDCTRGPEPGIGTTAEAITDAIAARPSLIASGATAVTVGALSGRQLDLRMGAVGDRMCGGEAGGFVPLFGSQESYGWGFVGIAEEERVRLVVLDAPGSGNFVVLVAAPNAATFKRYIDEAAAIIAGLGFLPARS